MIQIFFIQFSVHSTLVYSTSSQKKLKKSLNFNVYVIIQPDESF